MNAWLAALLLLGGMTGAHAALEARDINHDGNIDAYYDSAQNITVTADANLPATLGIFTDPSVPGGLSWQGAMDWAAGLDLLGVGGWRLPKVLSFECLPDVNYCFPTSSELSALPGFGPFVNVSPNAPYWLATLYSDDININHAGVFIFPDGHDHTDELSLLLNAWAVHDGDVAAVPEPSTWAALLGGLALLAGLRAARRGKPMPVRG